MSLNRQTQIAENQIDKTTNALTTIGYAHHEAHAGSRFYVQYSVADVGAATTPTDMMTLSFTTSDTAKWDHFLFLGTGTSGWRLRLIEAPTAGAATATGTLPIINHQRNSTKVSVTTNIAGTAAVVDYDATLATGGLTLWDDYIAGSTTGQTGNGSSAARDEIILKQNTTYQLSLYGTDNDAGTLYIDWYEHTNK